MPGLPAGLSGLFHLCEGSCLCATSPNGKTNRVLYCYGEVLFNYFILLSTIIIYNQFYCYGEVVFNCFILLSTLTSTAVDRSCLILSSGIIFFWSSTIIPIATEIYVQVHISYQVSMLRIIFNCWKTNFYKS